MKVIEIHRNGGAEVLVPVERELPRPAAGQVRVRHTAIGVNFSDVNVRTGGFYVGAQASFPLVLGNEAAGIVEDVGDGVSAWKRGDRVAYAGTGGLFFEDTGAYAQQRNLRSDCLVKLPDDISDDQAAALLLKGLTASVIINRCFKPVKGDRVLVHAAASGVGTLLAQWYSALGAVVIGTVGSESKASFARERGCSETILYRQVNFVEALRKHVPEGVAAVMDGVGKDTFLPSLDCIRPFGTIVNYGNASGPPPAFPLVLLAQKGCISLHRPGFGWHANTPSTRQAACDELFALVRCGALEVHVAARIPLEQAADAHRLLESGAGVGSVLLVP